MTQLDSAKDRAFSYLAELRQTAAVRQFFSEIIIGRNGDLMGAFGYDTAVKARLREAVKLKATPPAALYRGLFVQANSIFEAYVRDLSSIVAEHKVSRVTTYSELPEKFRLQHIHLSSQILQHVKTGAVAGQKFNFDRLTNALGQCFSNSHEFSIMPEVFTLMMGNATPDRLETLFEKLGLPEPFNPGVGRSAAIKKVIGEIRQASAAKLAKEKLHELVRLRNTLVHGDLSTAVEQSDLDEAVDFFEAMIESFDELARPILA
ncbi:MAE_28990/MAE_18760 family HEPN-like nuclease [Aurantimonas sp. C2-6-R+9]|uniref:MAE_28990/MAE_18760 family HEPN-like nuclease n=1 Tax=unclassified Aurantimonas TaxID=2638230 RepID=UPI002E1827DE|nr:MULTISPECIES: MAE_28990/MAE_18760 family HEPN-like nuclease [unclassified Aurantimonas]MEC5293196.1 MAE_28990/MAE_18760 family HEPN-like nuclease [Aurantimonas sp. C2-3-R2]MEC5383331.1 MAE_28990/MAE_18760 family HEPN-like nuclease [Aurantimonas sp. C2-6-R+9]MEC5414291.1 MAE_28990/MAE_18760 family HEPN-like nuclease [Aurantimonas sp. C2-4-R8]